MKKLSNKNVKNIWFVKVRWSYLPCSWQGWLLYIPMILFLAVVIAAINSQANTASEALYFIFPYFVCTGVVMHWIASNKS